MLINANATIKKGMLGNREESSRNHNLQADGSLTDDYLQCHRAGKPEKSGKNEIESDGTFCRMSGQTMWWVVTYICQP